MHAKPFWLIVIFNLFTLPVMAQVVPADTPIYSEAATAAIRSYDSVIGDQSEIYSGIAYHILPQGVKGSPYFGGKPFLNPAIMRYNGTWYQNIPVLYDTFADAMISAQRDSLYILRPDKTPDIYFSDHHFIYLAQQSGSNLAPGYYDKLYAGRSEVLVKRASSMQSRVSGQSVEIYYENKDVIYIKKGDAYYPVSGKGSVLDFFKSKSKQLKQYLKEKQIKYGRDKEGSIVRLAEYYDQINK
ncbi:MAG: hypothetical protein JST19_13955 [Bacteroidetes bacterium]|nr:hypothetical protein [Bacteroidota bacterium]